MSRKNRSSRRVFLSRNYKRI